MTDKRIVLTTAASSDEAGRIARALVEARLAACVNIIGPMASVFRWQTKVETASEFLLIIKTTAAAFERLHEAIRKLHSYELPGCVQVPIDAGSARYLEWIEDSVD